LTIKNSLTLFNGRLEVRKKKREKQIELKRILKRKTIRKPTKL
jgi:hypothetical protein